MKKRTRFLVLMLALVMMCLCLCGCDELDMMRQEQAFWVEKGNTDTLTYNENTYKKIDGSNLPDPLYNSSYDNSVYVTDPDVPVLLSAEFGEWLDVSDDQNFIYGYVYGPYETEYYGVYESSFETLYCKDELYDEVVSKIKNGIEYTLYGYEYYTYDEEDFIDEYHYYYLKNNEIDAINEVLDKVKPVEDYELINERFILTLDSVSEDKMFGKDAYEIYFDNLNTYYLAHYSETLGTYTCYTVPEKLNKTFDEIVSHCNSDAYGYF